MKLKTEIQAAAALVDAVGQTEYRDETDAMVGPEWRVQNLQDADWALQRIRELKEEMEENRAMYERAVARAQARLKEMNEKRARGVAFFMAHVIAWMQAQRQAILKGGKKKSRDLLNGTIGWRASARRLEVTDEAALLAWAQTQDMEEGLVEVKFVVPHSRVKAWAERTGQTPPGCEWKESVEEPYVKTTSGGDTLAKKEE